MNTNQNIVLDFTQNKSIEEFTGQQDLAIMPANLAKKALKALADRLSNASLSTIVGQHVDNLNSCNNMTEVIKTSIEFVQERDLIQNLVAENWNAYSIKEQSQYNGPKVIGKIDLTKHND